MLQTLNPSAIIEKALPKLDCKGALLAFSENGNVQTYSAGSIPQSDRHRPYYIYSISKIFTAIAVLKLCEDQGEFLDTSFAKLALNTSVSSEITVRQLLNHTSGLSDYFADTDYQNAIREHPGQPWSYKKLMQVGLHQSPLFAPGQGWSYSNPGYALLKELIEKLSRMPYYDYIDEVVIQKAELTETRPFLKPDTELNLLEGEDDHFTNDFRHQYHPGWIATGCFISTTSDVAKLHDALFTDRLITQDSLKAMTQTVDVLGNPPATNIPSYGLGLMHFRKSPLGDAYGHGGGGPGYTTYAQHYPNLKGKAISISLVLNKSLSQTPFELCDSIIRHYLDTTSE